MLRSMKVAMTVDAWPMAGMHEAEDNVSPCITSPDRFCIVPEQERMLRST